jgi:hypothetical protein
MIGRKRQEIDKKSKDKKVKDFQDNKIVDGEKKCSPQRKKPK